MEIPFIDRITWPFQKLYAQSRVFSPEQDTDRQIDSHLQHLCSLNIPENETHNGHTALETVRGIQLYLNMLDERAKRSDNHKWSHRPRLYAILRNIGGLGYMDEFIAARLTDFYLPLNLTTVPGCLKGDSKRELRDAFLKAQYTYLTKARCIEEGHDSRHWILPPHTSGDDYYISEKRLGHGSFGRLSIEKYARKRVLRARSEQSRRNEETLLNELKELRRLRHKHLVRIFGSYTDKEYIAYLMKPIADYTLAQFLGRTTTLDAEEQDMLRRFYGCLAGAVDYLHRNHIRHRDITARNVLICRGDVHISDFGSAYNWANKPGSMTRHRNTPVSPDYMAPEVARDEERGTASDMWSLGVVYLEMTTKLLGRRIRELQNVLVAHAKTHKLSPHPYANIPAIFKWIEELGNQDTENDHDKEPLLWVRSLLDTQPENRPSSRILMQDIHESPSFGAFCCFQCQPTFQDETAEHPIQERSGPAVDSQNTSAMVENFMEAFERQLSFGGMSVQRVDSIKEWVSGTADSTMHDLGSSDRMDDINKGATADDTARLTDRLHYGSYEPKYYTSIVARDPDPSQWEHSVEELAVPGSFPVHESNEQSGNALPDLPVHIHTPLLTHKVEKRNLQDSGLGFLEYESASSNNDDEKIDLFNEVSDISTTNSDNSETGNLEDDPAEMVEAFECSPSTPGLLFGEIDDDSETD
ncbi:kinase-like domain-containing protein, partial [Colletotrichum cereale]